MKFLMIFIFCSTMVAAQSEWPTELIKVEKPNYPRNKKASFCKRPIDMIDTIVVHHTESPTTSTALEINRMHLGRGSAADPWYMVAYSYLINSPYSGQTKPLPLVSEGRPLDIVGAHAGTRAFVEMDEEQSKYWQDGKIVCGKEDGDFEVDPNQISNGLIKANVTTIGIVLMGNYAPFSRDNVGGYRRSKPLYPTTSTLDMIARLSCQLQKKHPRMKKLRWHNFYNQTTCPGTVEEFIPQIIDMAKGYGCNFNS